MHVDEDILALYGIEDVLVLLVLLGEVVDGLVLGELNFRNQGLQMDV